MASTASIHEAPANVKTNRKLLKVTQSGADPRYFDFSIHAQRTECIKHLSWALRTGTELTISTAYVE